MNKLICASVGALMALGSAAQAAIVIDAAEVGPDVVFSFSGTFDLTGLPNVGSANDSKGVFPSSGGILFNGTGSLDGYVIPEFPVFGTGLAAFGVATGDIFKLYSNGFVGFAVGYAGESISGDLTLSGNNFGTIGVTPGSYSVASTNGDTITLNIPSVAQVPLPAALPLLVGALGGLGMMRRRKG